MQIVNGHHGEWEDPGWSLGDSYACSCGWRSHHYWDGADLAYDEWKKHAETSPTSAAAITEGVGL